jgi:hypothetical protein
MATARELLQQADALMRRNRAADPGPEIPELTEVVVIDAHALDDDSVTDFGGEGEAPSAVAETSAQNPVIGDTAAGPDTFPVLTEVVVELEPPAAPGLPDPGANVWPESRAEQDITIALPEALEVIPLPPIPAAAAPVAADERERDAVRWERLAEDIRMQVLQRIDIFTDTGMQEQLKERLQPIVDRASADLVATINAQVGQLLRTYVAEAIEREIDKWRQGGG